jgi:hypothetical protein
MEMLCKGKRKTPNDGQGKSGKKMPGPGMVNPSTMSAKKGAAKGPGKKTSKGMGY